MPPRPHHLHPSPPPPPPPPSLHAQKLTLPIPSLSTSIPTSLLFDPTSSSLAILLSDSSCLLFSNFSTSKSPTPIQIPAISSCCFSPLLPSRHVLFLAASPSNTKSHLRLRCWLSPHNSNKFVWAPLAPSRRLEALPFGLGARLAGTTNTVVLHSLAVNQIWLLRVRLVGVGGGVELHKCAVIELEAVRPVYCIGVVMGRLVLGETGGIRVFPLRVLMKGAERKEKGGSGGGVLELGKKSDSVLRWKNGVVNGMVVGSLGGAGLGDSSDGCKSFKL